MVRSADHADLTIVASMMECSCHEINTTPVTTCKSQLDRLLASVVSDFDKQSVLLLLYSFQLAATGDNLACNTYNNKCHQQYRQWSMCKRSSD